MSPQAGPQTATATAAQTPTTAKKELMVPQQPVQSQRNNDNSTLRQYYASKIQEAESTLAERMQNFRRLQAQRDELNNKVSTI